MILESVEEKKFLITQPEYTEEKSVPVRLMKNLVAKVIGNSTGKEYIFNGAGSVVNVDVSDLEIIRRKNQAHISCCGSVSSPYFEIL